MKIPRHSNECYIINLIGDLWYSLPTSLVYIYFNSQPLSCINAYHKLYKNIYIYIYYNPGIPIQKIMLHISLVVIERGDNGKW